MARLYDGEMKRKQMYGAQVVALRRVLSQYLNKNAMRRVTNSACRSWKKARATTAGVSMFFYCVNYGSMGCPASKRGITKLERPLVKSQHFGQKSTCLLCRHVICAAPRPQKLEISLN